MKLFGFQFSFYDEYTWVKGMTQCKDYESDIVTILIEFF